MKEEYGYCRISTPKQNIDRQERNILEVYPAACIIKEVYTGTKTIGRKEWNKLYKLVKQEAAAGKEIAAKEIILKNSKDFNGTNTDSEVIRIAGVSRNSYYKYKAELRQAAGD